MSSRLGTSSTPLAAIARLRRVVAHAEAGALGEDGRWLARALRSYLVSKGTTSLEAALGLSAAPGQERWGTLERRAQRDAAIRALYREHFAHLAPAAAATVIARLARRYECAWARERDRAEPPPLSMGTPRKGLWWAFRPGARFPRSARQVLKILRTDGGNQLGLFSSIDRADDEADRSATPGGDRGCTGTAAVHIAMEEK